MNTVKPAGDPWESMYELMLKEVPKNKKERNAAEMLHADVSLIETMLKSGLTSDEFNDLFKRLGDWENGHLVIGKPAVDYKC